MKANSFYHFQDNFSKRYDQIIGQNVFSEDLMKALL